MFWMMELIFSLFAFSLSTCEGSIEREFNFYYEGSRILNSLLANFCKSLESIGELIILLF